jgi:pilus assembly protein CpaE
VADISFVVFSEEDEIGDLLRESLEESGHANVLATVTDADEFSASVGTHKPDAVLVDLGHAPHAALDMFEALPAPRPEFVACGPEEQSDVILRALRQGAREFLPAAPNPVQVAAAVQRVVLEHAPKAESRKRAPLLAVMGAKGGVGATVVACQLAASLQRAGGRTVIVDLNCPLGDVALHFDVKPTYTLADVSRNAKELDASLVRGLLQRHSSDLHILAAPGRVEEAELVKESHVHGVLEILRQEFDWVVVDIARSWNEPCVRTLDLADGILLVTLQDVPTLTHARAHLDLLLRLGHDPAKIHTVANRYSKRDVVSDEDLVQFLGVKPEASLPNDYATTAVSVNEGRPVAEVSPGSELHLAFESLARQIYGWVGVEIPESLEKKPGLGARILNFFRREN